MITKKKLQEYKDDNTYYHIEWTSHYSKGEMIIKKSYYMDNLRKFNKLFKDVMFTLFVEEKHD